MTIKDKVGMIRTIAANRLSSRTATGYPATLYKTVAKPPKPQTKQDIATDFINSATKTQKKNDKFGW